jgi:hypothetical protein
MARRVERLAVYGWRDPESILVEKNEIARSLRRLASELDATK